MKRIIIAVCVALSIISWCAISGAGWEVLDDKNSDMARYIWRWTSNTSGVASITIGEPVGWHIVGITTGPHGGTPPTATYGLTITDDQGRSLASISGISTTLTETTGPAAYYPIQGPMTLAISGASSGATAQGNVIIDFE